jgi:phage terminase Nu1 subunit (DNA packaging protein)
LRRLQQLRDTPNPPPFIDGKSPCLEAGRWLRDRFKADLGISSDGEVYDYDAERARLTFHQANTASLEEARKKGELIPFEDVKTHWENLAANTRAKLLNLPGRLATALNEQSTVQERERVARELIYEALNELAGDGTP